MYTRRAGNGRYAPRVSPSTPAAAFSFSSKNASARCSVLMWWRSAVNLSFSPFLFLLCLAACRMRSSACVTVPRLCLRPVLCWSAFPSAPVLGSTGSATGCPALFAGFAATSTESDSPRPCIIGFGSSPSRCGPPLRRRPDAGSPGSRTRSVRTCQRQRPRRTGRGLALTPPPVLTSTEAKASASGSMVLSRLNVLAYAFPCRRFAPTLTDGQTHGLGPMWIATPSLQWTCTTYSLPVSPGAQPRTTHRPSSALHFEFVSRAVRGSRLAAQAPQTNFKRSARRAPHHEEGQACVNIRSEGTPLATLASVSSLRDGRSRLLAARAHSQ